MSLPASPTAPRCILFVDCDRFYFAVEAAERPGLCDDSRPVIIGYHPRNFPRGIVTTANDPARALGIQSGQSASAALRLAPNAVFIPPRRELYTRYSDRVMAILRDVSPLVQQNSIDEAACLWPHGFTSAPALALRSRVVQETGISVSLGLASSPLVAKMASETAKRRDDHLCIVPPGDEAAFLAPLPIRALVGIGPKTEKRLLELGITTVGALTRYPVEGLIGHFGRAYGMYLAEASHGRDSSVLSAERDPKSLSAERTFATDTADRHVLWQELRSQAEEIAARLQEEGVVAGDVAIKLRYADWQTLTRQLRLTVPTADATVLSTTAAALMRRHWDRTRPLRLIGLRAGHLTPATATQLPLPQP